LRIADFLEIQPAGRKHFVPGTGKRGEPGGFLRTETRSWSTTLMEKKKTRMILAHFLVHTAKMELLTSQTKNRFVIH